MNAIEGHTPLPWKRDGRLLIAGKRLGVPMSLLGLDVDGYAVVWSEADAALIVRAVNSHAEMVAALEAFVTEAESFHNTHHGSTTVDCDTLCDAIAPAKAALAKAKGEQ